MTRNALLFGIATWTLIIAAPLQAAEDNDVIEEIIVIGEKFGRSLQDTATSVGLVRESDLEDMVALDVPEAFDRLVNVNSEGANGGFVIRGIRFNDVSNSRSIGDLGVFYMDGVRLSQRGLRFGPDLAWDIASIEVLRGAQSTLQGRNALAGAIYVNTIKPSYQWDMRARGIYTEGNTWNVAAAIGGPIIADKLAFRISAERLTSDGFIDNPVMGRDDADFSDDWVFRGKLLFDPSDTISIDAVLNYSDRSGFEQLADSRSLNNAGFIDISPASIGSTPEAATFGDVQRQTLTNIRDSEDTETLAGLLRVTWDISDSMTLTSESSYSQDKSLTQTDNDSGVFDYSGAPLAALPLNDPFGIVRFRRTDFFAGGGDIPVDPIFIQEEENKIFSQEIRLKYDAGGRMRVLAGAYYTSEKEDEISYTQQVFTGAQQLVFAAALDAVGDPALAGLVTMFYANQLPLYVLSDEPTEVSNYALFAELEYDVSDRLTVNAGLRYDSEDLDVGVTSSGQLFGFPDPAFAAATVEAITGGAVPAFIIEPLFIGINAGFDVVSPLELAGGTLDSRSYDAFLPKLGITYRATDDLSVGVVAQRGYRAGSLAINVPRQLSFSLDPEYTWNYEAFFRSTLADGKATLNGNAYYTTWTDQQVGFSLDDNNPFDNGAGNAGKSRLYGFEVDVRAELSHGFSAYAAVGYSNTKFTEFSLDLTDQLASLGLTNADLAGLTTDFTGNEFPYAPKWSFVLGGAWQHRSGIKASLNVNHQTSAFDGPDNQNVVDARTLVNLRVGYGQETWQVFAFARNLLGETYVTDPNQFRPRLGDPRTFGAGIKVNF